MKTGKIILCFILCCCIIGGTIVVPVDASFTMAVVAGIGFVAAAISFLGITAKMKGDENVGEVIYTSIVEGKEDTAEFVKEQIEFHADQYEAEILLYKQTMGYKENKTLPAYNISKIELLELTRGVSDYLTDISIFDAASGQYKLALNNAAGSIDLSFDDLSANEITNMDQLPLVKGKFSYDFNGIDKNLFEFHVSNAYYKWTNVGELSALYIHGHNDSDIKVFYSNSLRSAGSYSDELGGHISNVVGYRLARKDNLAVIHPYYSYGPSNGTYAWDMSTVGYSPNYLRVDTSPITDFVYWFSTWGKKGTYDGVDYSYLAINIAYLQDGVYTHRKFIGYQDSFVSPIISHNGTFTIYNGKNELAKGLSGDIPVAESDNSFSFNVPFDKIDSQVDIISTVLDQTQKEEIAIVVPINPVTELPRENTTIKDIVVDKDLVDALEAEGVDTDKPSKHISPFILIPKQAVSKMWDYVIYLFTQASQFYNFLGSFFVALPEVMQFSFLGGFLLLIIVAFLKRVL